MQKWCPEPLVADAAAGAFESLAPTTGAAVDADMQGFRPETGFGDPRGMLRQMSRDERSQICELLDQDLRREYEERCRKETAAREAVETERIRVETERRERWEQELAAGLRREFEDALATLARRTVDVASLMATKLVRREVEHDREVLVRALETVLYKSEAGCPLSITVHPDEASWLESAPEVRERLRIREVKEDRRLEPGGCLVKVDDLEWDATIERQLAVLGEAVGEALAVPADTSDAPEEPHA